MHVGQGRGRDGGRSNGAATPASLPDRAETCGRALKGAVAYQSGLSAEDQVANHYQKRGYQIAAQRWRGQAGEVDLVLRKQAMLVFVEVKRARSFAIAAERLTQRQLARIIATASEFVATEPAGQDSEMRFDAALVDEIGRIEIRENIIAW